MKSLVKTVGTSLLGMSLMGT